MLTSTLVQDAKLTSQRDTYRVPNPASDFTSAACASNGSKWSGNGSKSSLLEMAPTAAILRHFLLLSLLRLHSHRTGPLSTPHTVEPTTRGGTVASQ